MIGTAFADGMTLAAMVQDDRTGGACAPGLAPGLRGALAARLAALRASSRAERHEAVRALAATLGAAPEDADAPPRALAILATEVSRDAARRWSAAAPAVRRGFRVTRGLKTTLRRLASSGPSDARGAELAAAERAEGLEPARLATLERWARLLGEGDERRALGALMLGLEGDLAGDPSSRRLRAIGRELAFVWEGAWRA
ncbi:MAG: hypothetical protein M5U28_26980 [Sandaracinaceae bacterium]|nr:hypothetical protein [Sandaracinaceae bacterium]